MQASSPLSLPDPEDSVEEGEEFLRACEAPALEVPVQHVQAASTATPVAETPASPAATSRLDALVQVIRAVTATAEEGADIEIAARACLDRLCAYLGWPVGHLYLVSETDPGALVSSRVWHLDDPDRFAAFRSATEAAPCSAGPDLPARVLASARATWVTHLIAEPDFARAEPADQAGLRGAFAMPIVIGAEAVGVLELFGEQPAVPDGSLTDLAPSIGAQLGRAVARRRSQNLANGNGSHPSTSAPASRAPAAEQPPADAAWSWNLRTGSVAFSPEWAAMAGCAEMAPRLSEWLSRLHPDDAADVCAALEAHISGHTPELDVSYRLCHAEGSYRRMRTRAHAVRDAAGRAFRVSGVQTDLSVESSDEGRPRERRGDSRRLGEEQAGLADRNLLIDRLTGAMARAGRRGGGSLAVLAVSLDRWERLNERLGHAAGERMLVTAARRIGAGMRAGDTVARMNGDGFAVLLEDVESPAEAVAVAERIHRELAQPIEVAGSPAVLTASIGIVLSSADYERPEDLLRDAVTAMRHAREMGGACQELFTPAMRAGANRG